MGIPEFGKCCCCGDLRIGTYILAILAVIGYASDFGLWLSGNRTAGFVQTFLIIKDCGQNDDECFYDVIRIVNIFGILSMIIDVIFFILAGILIHGIRKSQPRLFVPYMVTATITIIISIVCVIVTIGILVGINGHLAGIMTGSLIVISCLQIYFILCIHSYYKKLMREQANPTEKMVY